MKPRIIITSILMLFMSSSVSFGWTVKCNSKLYQSDDVRSKISINGDNLEIGSEVFLDQKWSDWTEEKGFTKFTISSIDKDVFSNEVRDMYFVDQTQSFMGGVSFQYKVVSLYIGTTQIDFDPCKIN